MSQVTIALSTPLFTRLLAIAKAPKITTEWLLTATHLRVCDGQGMLFTIPFVTSHLPPDFRATFDWDVLASLKKVKKLNSVQLSFDDNSMQGVLLYTANEIDFQSPFQWEKSDATINLPDATQWVECDTTYLDTLATCSPFINYDSARYALGGILQNGLYAYATNGKFMIRHEIGNDATLQALGSRIQEIITPAPKGVWGNKKLRNKATTIQVAFVDTSFFVRIDNLTVEAKSIDGKFPNCENIINPFYETDYYKFVLDSNSVKWLIDNIDTLPAKPADRNNADKVYLTIDQAGFRLGGNDSSTCAELLPNTAQAEIPQTETKAQLWLDREYLKILLRVAVTKQQCCFYLAKDSDAPLRITSNDCILILMPLSLGADDTPFAGNVQTIRQ